MAMEMPQAELLRRSLVPQAFKKICVIGLGYVGLPTAAVMASRGLDVTGVDINPNTISLINQGKIHIFEPNLETIVHDAVEAGMLRAKSEPVEADAFIVAVPTPFTDGNKPDLKYIEAATKSLAPVLKKGDLVIIESTSPVGATEQVSQWLGNLRADLTFPHITGTDADVQISHSPERVLPGRVLIELVRNDRVIGGITRHCAERTAELYRTITDGTCHVTTARTAELVKLMENAYRDVNIAFANEMSLVSDRLGINVWEAIDMANHHPRVNILQPGPGVGGHCIAVDPWFIVDGAPEDTALIKAARGVNDSKPEHVVKQVLDAAKKHSEPTIACLGLAYKANIDDLRESPAIEIVRLLSDSKAGKILVVEPNIDTLPDELSSFEQTSLCELSNALDQSDIIVLLVDHSPFLAVNRARLEDKTIFDTRGIWR
jgi:UDP-N-acetyl-D-mannosaminuronic acid dehydrogenase